MATESRVVAPVSALPFTAYIPCYNAAATIRRAVESVLAQTIRPAETLIVDDGSIDGSTDAVRDLDVRVVALPRNAGRGAARARAMSEARHDYVLCCDATNILDPRFVEQAMAWFAGAQVAAVFGRITQGPGTSVVDRWRGRHLYKIDIAQQVNERASLGTGAALMRASAVESVGGYDRTLRHTEDADLGARLLAAGWSVVYDPRLTFTSISSNTLAQVLERHWRWHAGTVPTASWREYRKSIGYSIKCMARDDLRAGDPLSIPISLVTPHYHLWRSLW
jgi:glycosyltransferase involved in cell wall biosynthesis